MQSPMEPGGSIGSRWGQAEWGYRQRGCRLPTTEYVCCMCGLCPIGTGCPALHPPAAAGPSSLLCFLETHPLGQRGHVCQKPRASPCCLLPGSGLPQACLWNGDLVLWCPVAFCHAGGFRGIGMGRGLELNLAVMLGVQRSPWQEFAKL